MHSLTFQTITMTSTKFDWTNIKSTFQDRYIVINGHWQLKEEFRHLPTAKIKGVRNTIQKWLFLAQTNGVSDKNKLYQQLCEDQYCVNPDHYRELVKAMWSNTDKWTDKEFDYVAAKLKLNSEERKDGCVVWKGPPAANDGFGKMNNKSVHQWAMICLHKDVNVGASAYIRHTCKNKLCLNTDHLEIVKVAAAKLPEEKKDPNRTRPKKYVSDESFERAQQHIKDRVSIEGGNLESDCWIMEQGVRQDNYPHLEFDGFNYKASRLSYMAFNKVVLDPLKYVLHGCKSKKCCNPLHLSVGDAQDNANDKIRDNTNLSGTKHPMCKTDEETVREIKRTKLDNSLTQPQRASLHNVSISIIKAIDKGATWKHVN